MHFFDYRVLTGNADTIKPMVEIEIETTKPFEIFWLSKRERELIHVTSRLRVLVLTLIVAILEFLNGNF